MVRAVINFTVLIQNENKNLCYELSYELTKINNISSSLKELITDNHEIFEKNAGHASAGRGNGSLSAFFLIMLFFLVLLRVGFGIYSASDSSNSKNSPLSKPKEVANRYYTNLRNEYAVIDAIKFDGERLNQDKIFVPYIPYYMLFESNSTDSIVVHVVNNGSESITLYLKSAYGIILDLSLSPSEKIRIERNKNTLDLLLNNYGDSEILMYYGKSRSTIQPLPIFISDSLNLLTHKLNLEDPDGVLNIDLSYTYKKGDFVMEIYSKPNEQGVLKNYLTFPGSQWTF